MTNQSTTKNEDDKKPVSEQFDHEKLDVYRLELAFLGWLTPLFDEVKKSAAPRMAEVTDQLDRASLSALLNTAEGNGKRQRQTRAKFFDDARGSATECAACLDALAAKRTVEDDRIREGKQMLLRIVSMLTKLVQRFEEDSRTREETDDYAAESSSSSSSSSSLLPASFEDEDEGRGRMENA